ncbi:hypothetical protein HGRIS_011958 [Hohenbuehelia grisea]|uniref:Aminoglycoside phosphotransferase domain-containing protein n=1 Tax=Hohenbuehelia grisea TaxID=104357 RepID=A0ABR3JWM9_9AGAR
MEAKISTAQRLCLNDFNCGIHPGVLHDILERVRNLLSALYGEGCAASATISRRTGGSFNRIIGVHLPSANDATEDLILRIPRFDNIDVGRDIVQQSGVLCGLRPFLPVPEVAALGRVASQPIRASLHDYVAHPRLNTVQYSGWFKPVGKMRIAAQVARLISAIHSAPVPQAVGSLSADEGGRLTVARITRHDEGLDTATLDSKSLQNSSATSFQFATARFATGVLGGGQALSLSPVFAINFMKHRRSC